MECSHTGDSLVEKEGQLKPMKKVLMIARSVKYFPFVVGCIWFLWGFKYTYYTAALQIEHSEVMEVGDRVYVPVSVVECRISKRFDTIPSGTLHPNADEIQYLQRLVKYKVCLS